MQRSYLDYTLIDISEMYFQFYLFILKTFYLGTEEDQGGEIQCTVSKYL